MTGRHRTEWDGSLSLAEVVRFVAGLDAVTVKDLRDGLGFARSDADQALTDLSVLGLVGPAARGRRRPVLFTFRTPPTERSVDLPGVLGGDDRLPPDDPADDPGATQGDEPETVDPDWETSPVAPASPFSDPVVPPDPFTDSDGNQWPTRDPFGPVDF